MEVFVARQPIFDREQQLYAYELLFRSAVDQTAFDCADGAAATLQVIANSLLTIGLENVSGGKKAFINFDRELLMGGLLTVLPPESVIIEILETVEPDADLVTACQGLLEQGYTIALDDFVSDPRWDCLVEIAKVIKVDMRVTSKAEQERLLQTYRPRGIAMLAEKVETREEFDWARQAGYDFYQGYFFTRPVVVRGQQIPACKATCLQLLQEVQADDLDFRELSAIISKDVALSFKLLQYTNSALFHRLAPIHSIGQCLSVIGEEKTRHWAVLAALPLLAKDKPGELVTLSLVRARFCERVAQLSGLQDPKLGFIMGLFSFVDALIDAPFEEALLRVSLPPPVREALLGSSPEDDVWANVYGLVCRYELGDWDAVISFAEKLKIQPSGVGEVYAESTLWAQQALHATSRKKESRRKVRHGVSGTIGILWEDASGQERRSTAKVSNVSVSGLQLIVTDRIPPSTYVACNDHKLGIAGRGCVRYCNFSKGKYVIGVEFSGGTGWREPLAQARQSRP